MKNLLIVNNLVKYFPVGKNISVHAVDDVSFSIKKGETLGLVGESGCGKTTVGRCLLRLIEPDSGIIQFKDKNIMHLNKKQLFRMRREMQIIFQDPYSSLNPRKNVLQLISEPLLIHKNKNKDTKEKVFELMELVGLTKDLTNSFPHEMDGGRCQRIGIARALALSPELIVCDEPVSALDVSIQAQILNLLQDLQSTLDLTYLFISHNLSVVKHLSARIIVMYLGKIMEIADTDELFNNPSHPYTQALLDVIPIPVVKQRYDRNLLEGDVPTPINPKPGCRFNQRCKYMSKICVQKDPVLEDIGYGHMVACLKVKNGIMTKNEK